MGEATGVFNEIMMVLKKRKGLIFGFIGGATALALGASLIWPPTYEAASTLRVRQAKNTVRLLPIDFPASTSFPVQQLMGTYSEVIKSESVVNAMIDQAYNGRTDKEKPTYEDMLKRITTQPVRDTEILRVRVAAGSAEESARLTNQLVETFNQRLTELGRAEQRAGKNFIGDRLTAARNELEKAEAELEKYKSEHKILAPNVDTSALVAKQSSFDTLAANNRVALAMSQAQLATAQAQLANMDPGFVADNETIQQYKNNLVQQEVQLVELVQRYTEKHPAVVTLRKQIDETKTKLAEEAAKAASAKAPSANKVYQDLMTSRIQAEAGVAAAAAQQQAIRGVIEDNQKEMADLPAKERGLTRLMREANVAQETYVMLAKRHEEARIAEVMEAMDVQLVDVASVPAKPIKPRVALNTLLGALLGLTAGIGLAFLREYRDSNA